MPNESPASQHPSPERIMAMLNGFQQTGILKGRRRRAVDSTILDDAVATQDTVTQLVSAIRKVAREVPGAAEQVAAVCTGHDYSRPGKPTDNPFIESFNGSFRDHWP